MKLLGFRDVVTNSLDAVSSRLEVECETAAWLALWMTHASCLAQDLILFSMEEFRWIRLAPETTTGSSIMPQKRNPDFAEVIKGKASLVHGALASLLSLGKGQPSGYHRDSQYSKPLGQDIWREVSAIPTLFKAVLQTMTLDRIRMKQAVQGDSSKPPNGLTPSRRNPGCHFVKCMAQFPLRWMIAVSWAV
ncbi:MAG: hypothetical protein IPI28_04320 [Candidatus Omnitrophica bacterium]|nr:hypothetical protein [Candidatus Omnitrophota bacterium]